MIRFAVLLILLLSLWLLSDLIRFLGETKSLEEINPSVVTKKMCSIETKVFFPCVSNLEIKNNSKLQDTQKILRFRHIESLTFSGCNQLTSISDFSNWRRLKTLCIENCELLTKLDAVEEASSLEDIYISLKTISDFSQFEKLKKLKFLSLDCPVSQLSLASNLEFLRIVDATNLTSLNSISSSDKLRNLSLSNCGMQIDASFFKELKKLEHLCLDGCKFEAIEEILVQLPKLKVISVKGCESVDALVVRKIQATYPDLEIYWREEIQGNKKGAQLIK